MAILDPYSTYARAFPVYITIAPIALMLFIILPEGFDWKLGGAASIILLPLSYLCRQIGGDLGKKRESALWDKWNGPPTTRFLRHGNNEFNVNTRNRIHDKLRRLGLYVPSQDEQNQNPQETDSFYESCVDELRRQTRDTDRFHLVFKGVKEYGFRRNIFALKPYGLTLAVVVFCVCLVMGFDDWSADKLSGSILVPVLINLGLIIVWLVWFTEKGVRLTADRYARFLLEAALDLEVKNADNSLSEC